MINIQNFFKKIFYENNRDDKNFEHFYNVNAFNGWSDNQDNVSIALDHPILTPALLFVSRVFSSSKFYIKDNNTGKIIRNHWLLSLLNRPNYYNSLHDLLLSTHFYKIVNGVAILYLKRGIGVEKPDSIYVLDYSLITFPEEFKTEKTFNSDTKEIDNKKIIYDKDGENLSIKIKDLIFIYDLPNGVKNNKNIFSAVSRLDGLKQTLYNTKDSLIAKNIILKSNGKEMISVESASKFPLKPDEKKDAEDLLNVKYGLSFNRKRGLVTSAQLNWKSMHIALRDLGLDESIKVDGNLIYTALHIPKDILSLEAKKTTYNNFKESMVSYIQNEAQSALNDFTSSLTITLLDNNLELVGSYDHLPIMQYINKEKYAGIKAIGEALSSLINAGIPEKEALIICGLDENIKLNKNGNKQQ